MNEIPIYKHTPSHKRQAYIAGKAMKTGFHAAYKMGLIKHRKPRTRALIVFNNQFLVVHTTLHPHVLSLPGGGIKDGESAAGACARELREEVGLKVSSAVLAELGTFTKDQTGEHYDIACFLYEIHSPSDKAIKPNHEIYDAEWISFTNLPANLPPLVLLALKSYVEYVRKPAS